jgi:hypothetical protein
MMWSGLRSDCLEPNERHQRHFLGAVVVQQVQNLIGLMQTQL